MLETDSLPSDWLFWQLEAAVSNLPHTKDSVFGVKGSYSIFFVICNL